MKCLQTGLSCLCPSWSQKKMAKGIHNRKAQIHPKLPVAPWKWSRNNVVPLVVKSAIVHLWQYIRNYIVYTKNVPNWDQMFLKLKEKIKHWTLWRKDGGGINFKDNVEIILKKHFRRYRRETVFSTLGNPMHFA